MKIREFLHNKDHKNYDVKEVMAALDYDERTEGMTIAEADEKGLLAIEVFVPGDGLDSYRRGIDDLEIDFYVIIRDEDDLDYGLAKIARLENSDEIYACLFEEAIKEKPILYIKTEKIEA